MPRLQWLFFYTITNRPARNRRTLADPDLDDMDQEIEAALLWTLKTKVAIRMLLWQFHSSPAKGRLWKKGYRVVHRVVNRREVAAWVELDEAPNESTGQHDDED